MKGIQFVLKIVIICGPLLCSLSTFGQSPSELALKNIQKQKWQRAYDLLTKALAKDSLNVTAKYVLAQYFFSEGNPAFDLDSAYDQVLEALQDFQQTSMKQRERLRRFPVDSLQLINLRENIDSVAFERAKAVNSENALTDFILHFPLSSKIKLASDLRDSIVYTDAIKQNTSQAFEDFMKRYPKASQSVSAKEKYEKLLLAEKTSDQTLASYEIFLADYPNSPYRSFVEQMIFEYRTASGEVENFIAFVNDYPKSRSTGKAKNILFHLIPEKERGLRWPKNFSNDSLNAVINLGDGYIVPFLKNGRFGFIDKDGNEVVSAQADSIDQAYLCGNIGEDVLAISGKIVANNGAIIWNGRTTNIDDIGFGFLLAEDERCRFLIHKTGALIGQRCIDNAKILNGKFVALLNDKHWSIYTLAGKLLIENLDEVFSIRDIIVLKRNATFKLMTSRQIALLPASHRQENGYEFEEVKPWTDDLAFVKIGSKSGVLDQALNFFIELENHVLSPAFFGTVAASSSGTFVYNSKGQKSDTLQHVIVQDPWVAVKVDSIWRLYDPKTTRYSRSSYDTIVFSGLFPTGYKNDSISVFFSPDNFWQWSQPVRTGFIFGPDSSAFLMLQQGDKKSIYNRIGQRLFTTTFDRIQYAGNHFFIAHKKEKKGLLSYEGKLLLPVEYDAIGMVNNGLVSLLKNNQFGLFDCVKKKLIKAGYRKNLILYNSNVIVAYKNGLYGFIGWDNKPLSEFEFNEIQYWNDTVAFVKKNSEWMLYEAKTRKILLDKIKDYKLILNKPTEKLAIIHQGANYGVVHNQKGTIIPVTFSDLINVGSAEEPMYFTEKHIEEASIYVVIYYDSKGKMLRKEVYDPDDYDQIYCAHD